MKNPFESLNNLIKIEKPPEKRMIRHSKEREIIDTALANLSESALGQELVQFITENNIKITVLRGRDNRDYTPSKDSVFISVAEDMDADDPEITIHLVAAIRESMQEHDPMLRTPSLDQGEAIYVHRMGQKDDDKLIWQTKVTYELGKLAKKSEFIDSFTLMGYHSLIDVYEKELNEN